MSERERVLMLENVVAHLVSYAPDSLPCWRLGCRGRTGPLPRERGVDCERLSECMKRHRSIRQWAEKVLTNH